MRLVDPIGLAKAILWEEAKGKLRAIVMADGADQSRGRRPGDDDDKSHYEYISEVVEKFITDFEGDGWHE